VGININIFNTEEPNGLSVKKHGDLISDQDKSHQSLKIL
jgi:hypothetical protein